jgi:hypothetical protein
VLVLMKFNTWPGVAAKYSGTFAGISAAALLAVTTAVLSMVARRGKRARDSHLSGLTAKWCRELRESVGDLGQKCHSPIFSTDIPPVTVLPN